MDIYDSLFEAVRSEYDTLTLIKKSERGECLTYTTQRQRHSLYFQVFLRKQRSIPEASFRFVSESAKDHGSRGKRWKDSASGRVCAGRYAQ